VLIGVNTRYEGSNLNLHLRNRFLKGNFKITSIGSVIDSNIPSTYLGLNVRTIKDMCEGNLFLCQELLGSTNPVIIVSSEVFKRQDSESLSQLLKTLKKNFGFKIWRLG
jgi:hypothetical protein